MTYEPYPGPYGGGRSGGADGYEQYPADIRGMQPYPADIRGTQQYPADIRGTQQHPADTQDPQWQLPPAPASVVNAVKVMYAGAAVSVISVIVGLATSGAVKSEIHASRPDLTAAQVSAYAEFNLVSVIIVGLVGVGMWIWLARMCRDGRRVVRVFAATLLGVDTLLQIFGFTQPITFAARIPGLVVWLVGLAAVALLWRRDATDFFNAAVPFEEEPWLRPRAGATPP
jgi:hypothetical protein